MDELEVERDDTVMIRFQLVKAYPQIIANETIWSKDNIPIVLIDDKYSVSMDTLSLTVYNMQLSDEGKYTIIVNNGVDSASSSVTIELFGETR